MNPATLSLIIPCYNVQDYVQAALQSVWDNLSEENRQRVQWIIVNDGARDNTPAVIESFIAQNLTAKNVPHQYITQENAGLSAARNTGLAHATGDYVLFLDSDDIFVQAALDKILAVLDQYQPDIVEFDAQMFHQYSDLTFAAPTLFGDYFRDTQNLNPPSSLHRAFEENRWYVWSRCYRRALLHQHPFVAGKLFEDMMFTPYVYLAAQSFYALPEVLLGYRQNAGSITANVSQRHIDDLFLAFTMALDKIPNYPNHQAELRILQFKTWRLMVAYAVKRFLKTRDVAFLQHIQRYRAQAKARFGVDFGWCVGYFLGSLWRRWRKKWA
ncbi:glycosyltransferase [Kingella kingae]|uniref:glycosyltransferase n=1 Tax=Kingella kingae TaxID=504 RepID=UPI00056EA2AA|nr:glycosyltransferase [Kingella kingae]MDK4544145.1 glycosyltransferase [Kingella kingae]MDK4566148.1 glycosyltransferase [Kingella kingae]MDK4590690.1 glycosyltransferase [Kingella kingae]MDK4627978.1 glycosyltransferase [Kingella kingae]MDK4635735.1 glycosyltransferase [Kingella kingae]